MQRWSAWRSCSARSGCGRRRPSGCEGSTVFAGTGFASRFDAESDGAIEEQSQNYQRLRRELLDAERGAIVELRRDGVISNDVMMRLLRDLDLEDARLDV